MSRNEENVWSGNSSPIDILCCTHVPIQTRYFFPDDKSWGKQELASSSDCHLYLLSGTSVSPEHKDFSTDWYRDDAVTVHSVSLN
ncbi:unnamed protein product [Auanema sp. JU1783]|nr:unnamed protein product [Auanema sp. JU1783]